jgi:hypothetical protein
MIAWLYFESLDRLIANHCHCFSCSKESVETSAKSFLMKVFLLSSCAWYVSSPLPHHRSHSALHAEQMKLRLLYLWLLALAKNQVAADVLAAFHQQHAKLQTLLAAANTAPGRAALEKFLKTATPGVRPSRII